MKIAIISYHCMCCKKHVIICAELNSLTEFQKTFDMKICQECFNMIKTLNNEINNILN